VVGFALSIVIAMRVLCVTLLLWGCVQGIKVHKDLTAETDASATVVAEIVSTFKKVHGAMPEGYSLNPKAFLDPEMNFHVPWDKIKSLVIPDSIAQAMNRRGTAEGGAEPEKRSLTKYLTCNCPVFMYGWVVGMNNAIETHLAECSAAKYTKDWQQDESGGGRRAVDGKARSTVKEGATTILAKVEWTKLNTQMIKVFGEPVPRAINNRDKFLKLLARADNAYFARNPKMDYLILRWVVPYLSCSATGGIGFSCIALQAKAMDYMYEQDSFPESLKPYLSGLKTENQAAE